MSHDIQLLIEDVHAAVRSGGHSPRTDRRRAREVGEAAQTLAATKYSYDAYLQRTRDACAALAPQPSSGAIVKDLA